MQRFCVACREPIPDGAPYQICSIDRNHFHIDHRCQIHPDSMIAAGSGPTRILRTSSLPQSAPQGTYPQRNAQPTQRARPTPNAGQQRRPVLLLFVILLALASIAVYFANSLRSSNTGYIPPNSPTQNATWRIRLYNMDDLGEAKLNGVTVGSVRFDGYGQWVDVSNSVVSGENTLVFTDWNGEGGYTWGFSVEYNGKIVWDDHSGTQGSWGANNDDRSRQQQTVYEKTLILQPDGSVIEQSSRPNQSNPSTSSGQNNPSTGTNSNSTDNISVGTTVEVTAINLNIRSGAGSDNASLAVVSQGAYLQVVGGPVSVPTTSDDGQPMMRDWWEVSGWDNYGSRGWCSSRYLKLVP